MLNKIATHLYEIANTIDAEPCLPVYSPLKAAFVLFLRECSQALSEHIESQSSSRDRLNRDIITAAMDLNQRWDDWLENLQYPDLPHASTKILHAMLLRFSKGAVKAWRCWQIDLKK